MNRTPPIEVRRALRKQVGFGCPIQNCGNPYLEWHHFDPPWREKKHHNIEGMIALCAEHHRKADAGAYTGEQLQRFKKDAENHSVEVRGKFDWLRNRLLSFVGGGFYYEVPVIFQYKNIPVVWFNRDEDDHLLLNIQMVTASDEERAVVIDNYWIKKGDPEDLECPPSGKYLKIAYTNGDYLKIEFRVLGSSDEVQDRYPHIDPIGWKIDFPITAVEVEFEIAGTGIKFGPSWTSWNTNIFHIGLISHCKVGMQIA